MAEEAGSIRRNRLRVALVGCSGLLGDIIHRVVSHEADLEVVADLPLPDSVEDLARLEADVVLWNEAEGSRFAEWISRRGRAACPPVLATHYDGRAASLWELLPRETDLGALSPATLVETIRAVSRDSKGVA